MNRQLLRYAAALALALAAGSAQAGAKVGGGSDRAGDGGNGVQLNGIPASGLAVETVKLPDGTVIVQRSGGEKQCIQLGAMRPGPIPVMSGSRGYERQCVQLSAIPAIVLSRKTMQPVDGTVSGVQLAEVRGSNLIRTSEGRWGNGVQLNGISATGFAVETVELPDGAVAGGGWGSVGGGSDGF